MTSIQSTYRFPPLPSPDYASPSPSAESVILPAPLEVPYLMPVEREYQLAPSFGSIGSISHTGSGSPQLNKSPRNSISLPHISSLAPLSQLLSSPPSSHCKPGDGSNSNNGGSSSGGQTERSNNSMRISMYHEYNNTPYESRKAHSTSTTFSTAAGSASDLTLPAPITSTERNRTDSLGSCTSESMSGRSLYSRNFYTFNNSGTSPNSSPNMKISEPSHDDKHSTKLPFAYSGCTSASSSPSYYSRPLISHRHHASMPNAKVMKQDNPPIMTHRITYSLPSLTGTIGSSDTRGGVSNMNTGLGECASSRTEMKYELIIRQQPIAARACGFGERDRRVIDPPPIIQLQVTNRLTGQTNIDELRYSLSVVHCTLYNAEGTMEETALFHPDRRTTRRLMGQLVASPLVAKDEHDIEGCFFCFPDLSCRTHGRYRLRFILMRIDPAKLYVGSSTPIITEVLSDVFTVYNAKDFPGMRPSSALTRALKLQGCNIQVKKGNERALIRRRMAAYEEEQAERDSELEERIAKRPKI